MQNQNQYQDFLIDPNIQRIEKLSCCNLKWKMINTRYYLLELKSKESNIMTDAKNALIEQGKTWNCFVITTEKQQLENGMIKQLDMFQIILQNYKSKQKI